MSNLTVEKLSHVVGIPADKLLNQMSKSGLKHTSNKDLVTEEDRKILLIHLKKEREKNKSKTITLKRKDSSSKSSDISSQTSVSIKRKVSQKREDNAIPLSTKTSTDGFNFSEIEKKRVVSEELKKADEDRKKREVESKTLVKRKKIQTIKKEVPSAPNQPSSPERDLKKSVHKKEKQEYSKKEQRELEGEEYLKKEQTSQHAFEKPTEFLKKQIEIPEAITVSALAQKLSIKGGDLVKKLMDMGVMATFNQTIDQDTAILVTEELGHIGEASKEVVVEDKLKEMVAYEGKEASRVPVVSVLGHVDHGKTTLLDFIRKAKVAHGEEGGITQRIGAYQSNTSSGVITFIDTPGHAAFTEVRARGANSTDIVVLVVAADDGLQPQTEEAINHARVAEVPIIVAVNKMDKEEADLEKVKNELSSKELVPEDWGGKTQFIPISALKGDGVEDLLEAISLEAEVLDLKTHHKGPGFGIVLDSSIETGQGAVATVIVQKGTLKAGDIILVGDQTKKVRSLLDENGKKVKEAGPSLPVLISGLDKPPSAGEEFVVVLSEKMAKEISADRLKKDRESKLAKQQITSLESLFEKELPSTVVDLVIKADTHGSLEAILGSLKNLEKEEVKINIIHEAVGGINENDVNLALTSSSSIIGFNVRSDNSAKKLAEKESVEIFYSGIIYDLIDGVKELVEGKMQPEIKEEILGTAEVKETFKSPNFGLIAGSMVIEGTIKRNKNVRVIRDDIVIFEGQLDSLKRFKDDASEVSSGTECGIGIENYSDVKAGDKIEVFDKVETKRSL